MKTDDLQAAFETWFASLPEAARAGQSTQSAVERVCTHLHRVVRYQLLLTGVRQSEEVDNVCQDALSNLCRELKRWCESGSDEVPENPKGFLNAVARNACFDAGRKRSPEWSSMMSKVRYRAAKSKEYKCWEFQDQQVCGFADMEGAPPLLDRGEHTRLTASLRISKSGTRDSIDDLVISILNKAGQPLPLELLVQLALLGHGIHGPARSLAEEVVEGVELVDTLDAHDPDPEVLLLQKRFVMWMWNEVTQLPVEQGRVTGLNLEAVTFLSLEAFLECGVATEAGFGQLIAPVRTKEVKDALPLPDIGIAEVLDLLIDRVRDIRGSAKKRIHRRYEMYLQQSSAPAAESGGVSRLWQKMVRKGR